MMSKILAIYPLQYRLFAPRVHSAVHDDLVASGVPGRRGRMGAWTDQRELPPSAIERSLPCGAGPGSGSPRVDALMGRLSHAISRWSHCLLQTSVWCGPSQLKLQSL
ncbi:MAG TPA: hypothetical protein VH164_04655 [Ktedonobacteraceae bacterium]|nr:hypothetical protein [Ktedonobacteraceae bacterium]